MDTDQLIEEICRNANEGVLRIVVQCLAQRYAPERIIRCLLKKSTEGDINDISRIIMSSRNDYHRGQGAKKVSENFCQGVVQQESLNVNEFQRQLSTAKKKIESLEQTNDDLQMQLSVAKSAAAIRTRLLCQTANDTVAREKYKFLGKGCFGVVHGMGVAVKEPVDPSPKGLKQFQREAELLKMFHHPNIVKCVGYDQNNGKIFMELMDGNLQQLQEQEKQSLNNEDRKLLMEDASRGLMELHEKRTIHRDIKPNNIMINKFFRYERPGVKPEVKVCYEAKISDLGLAVQCPEHEAKERQLELERGKEQDVLGFARVMEILFTDPQTGNVQDVEVKRLIDRCRREKLTMKEVNMKLLEMCHCCWRCKPVVNCNPSQQDT
ncbi:dual specificity protein kinase shkE-like [Montipora capricornis]|uniref:dual specificity protein kinase shkE-like n=1 Tax=Montipora capricornis TaxID=246305 RepID=UPI0035F1A6A9